MAARDSEPGNSLLMKQRIPWPVKFAVKVLIGALRLDYRLLKRAHIVEHGRMEQADFSAEVFNRHVVKPICGCNIPPMGALLELGPGDSVSTGVLGRTAGFAEVILVDVGCFADLRPDAVNSLASSLGDGSQRIPTDATPREVVAQLRGYGIIYLTAGIDSLRSVAADHVQHSFSNSVLQHVHRDELPQLVALLAGVHAKGSYSSHSVNFTDHFSGGFVNHRLPDWVMESRIIKRANLYTNRESAQRILELFETAGFVARKIAIDFFDRESPDPVEYDSAAAFRIGTASRPILRAVFLLQKN